MMATQYENPPSAITGGEKSSCTMESATNTLIEGGGALESELWNIIPGASIGREDKS